MKALRFVIPLGIFLVLVAFFAVGLTRDLYVSLGEPVGDGAWGVRIYHKPFVDWIWGGAFIMALGGFLAIADRRYRFRRAATLPAGSVPRGAD